MNTETTFDKDFSDAINDYRINGNAHDFRIIIMGLRPECRVADDLDSLNMWIEQIQKIRKVMGIVISHYWDCDPSWNAIPDYSNLYVMKDGTRIRWSYNTPAGHMEWQNLD